MYGSAPQRLGIVILWKRYSAGNSRRYRAPDAAADLSPELNDNNPRCEVMMRSLLKFILIIGVIGSLVYLLRAREPSSGTHADARDRTDSLTKADKLAPPSLSAPVPKLPAQKKVADDTQVDSEQAALVNVMKGAIAARHGGVLPKTLFDEDARAASQAATNWQAKQPEQKIKHKQSSSERHN
jgi:hypothetical protein